MNISQQIAKNYSKALLSIISFDKLEDIYSEFEKLCKIFSDIPLLEKSFQSPLIKKRIKHDLMTVLTLGCNVIIRNFFFVLLKEKRINLLSSILKDFQTAKNNLLNKQSINVFSAHNLTDTQLQRLKINLNKLLSKEIEINHYIDKKIISGLKIEIGNLSIDNTTKNNLNKILHQFA